MLLGLWDFWFSGLWDFYFFGGEFGAFGGLCDFGAFGLVDLLASGVFVTFRLFDFWTFGLWHLLTFWILGSLGLWGF